MRVGRDRAAQHRETLVDRSNGRHAIVRTASRQEDHALEPELDAGCLRDEKMGVVHRVEGSTEQPDLHGAVRRTAAGCAARTGLTWAT